ncbi:dUTP diphosphatase [Anaeromicrobium sediminis]|uniref:Deoxyuridine 5'-triphosphate nucleotidohydrolase n=1 Tax=Anaeromicrobium sediminis TaxID=1478221 RepID=A0A267MNV8_9FIRM|nr:dUTP diphosphatase [Anaeromicrobium sediminis]PAB61216.1 deoxyuridine 5'-triphosphate nucleotidohydrolase [Anaeromicrobium sediminis]
MTRVKIVTKEGAQMPKYETNGSAGMDLRAHIKEDIIIKPGKRSLIGTGIHIQLPQGTEAQVRARSGLAIKYGIGVINGIGTIDSDYRGEIKVPLINWGEEDFVIKNGDRIAQLVICRYEKINWEEVETLDDTSRGEGGFGHTGI